MLDNLGPLAVFCFSSSSTPGPNNIMITAAGANYGVRRSLGQYLGIVLGFPAMVFALGLGLAAVFDAFPIIHEILRYVGAAYLCWLGARIAMSRRTEGGEATGRPLTFLESAGFQWVNPKAWIMAIGAISAFTTGGEGALSEVSVIVAMYVLSGFIGCGVWLVFGVAIGGFLTNDTVFRIFNLTLGGLTIASVILLFI